MTGDLASVGRNPYWYAAGYTTPGTGLTKFGARYYEPNTGRFTQQGPSGQETNPHAYAGDKPLNFLDPTGSSILGDVAAGLGLVSAAISTVGLALNEVPSCTVEGAAGVGVSCILNTAGLIGSVGGVLAGIDYFAS